VSANIVDSLFWLTAYEKAALAKFKFNYQKGGVETHPLSTKIALDLYSLYREGITLTEIAELNPQLGLPTIVNSAVEQCWYQRRQDYLTELFNKANEHALQVAAEGANFITTMLSVAHKKHGAKLRKYLQTDNKEDLSDAITIESLKTYKDAVEIFMKITGQDNVKKVSGKVEVEHSDKPAEVKAAPSPMEVATSIIELAAKKRAKKEE
jgi:hypothetical protein